MGFILRQPGYVQAIMVYVNVYKNGCILFLLLNTVEVEILLFGKNGPGGYGPAGGKVMFE